MSSRVSFKQRLLWQGMGEASGQAGMGEEEYQAAVAETAELAAHLPRIGVVGRPPQGPSMPQRLFNRFRSPEAVLGKNPFLLPNSTRLNYAHTGCWEPTTNACKDTVPA